MTKASKRTHPTDRDGDGKPGGSLPGNMTAPFATAEDNPADNPADTATAETSQPAETPAASSTPAGDNQPDTVDDLADARTTPGDSPEKLDAINRETDEANAAARAAEEAEFQADAAAEAREDSGSIEGADEEEEDHNCPICAEVMNPDDLCLDDVTEGTCHAECLKGSTLVNRDTGEPIDGPEPTPYRYAERLAPRTGNPILDAIAEAEPDLVTQTLEDHADDFTFDAEQVEAGTGDAVSFDVTDEEYDLIDQIVIRGTVMDIDGKQPHDEQSSRMDITATHANGTPLRLQDLLEADDFNFAHDWYGIRNCIDRATGKLTNFFRPRFSQPQPPEQAEAPPQTAARKEMVHIAGAYRDDAAA